MYIDIFTLSFLNCDYNLSLYMHDFYLDDVFNACEEMILKLVLCPLIAQGDCHIKHVDQRWLRDKVDYLTLPYYVTFIFKLRLMI